MTHYTRDLTQPRCRRQLTVTSTVHAARRPRRAHSSRFRLVHAAGASLALAALGYLAAAKADEFIPAATCDVAAVVQDLR
jgi:hypothetical protein